MDSVLIRYHEIALKKGNRSIYRIVEKKLGYRRKRSWSKEIRSLPARLLLTFKNDIDQTTVIGRIRSVFGVANFSPVERTSRELDVIRSRILTP